MKQRVLAIVGLGPRGSYALENCIIELANRDSSSYVKILLFEKTDQLGNGQVYDTHQSDNNWLNISERILHLDERKEIIIDNCHIPSFPSYHTWAKLDFTKISKSTVDKYPPRKKLGNYLKERFKSLLKPLLDLKIVFPYNENILSLSIKDDHKISLVTASNTFTSIDEVLLTIGHQPTKLSKQLQQWSDYSAQTNTIALYTSPYPIARFIESDQLGKNSKVGIRGFGLAAIDVIRSIANKYGHFTVKDDIAKTITYIPTEKGTLKLHPFSLDGLPPVPKPISAEIDRRFVPTSEQLLEFESLIGCAHTQKTSLNYNFLIDAFTSIAASIYLSLDNSNKTDNLDYESLKVLISKWLINDDPKSTLFLNITDNIKEYIQKCISMATGQSAISLDYCIGQVWRHCQPSIYKSLSFNQCSDEVFAKVIALDESTKRFSYGPPVESMQQLLALIDAEVLDLNFLDNPTFELLNTGWKMTNQNKAVVLDIMINSVLSSPKIESVETTLIKNMLADDMIEAVHDQLGVVTDKHGYVISANNKKMPIALLGRLAKGTIIGVDAILECYGDRPKKWAKEYARNHMKWLEENRQ